MAFDDNLRELSIGELENANTDRTVNPAVMVRGIMTRTSTGAWAYAGQDAGNFRVSSIGGSITTSPLSADSSSISAKQSDATNLMVSAKSNDASLFRVSALGVTATTSPLSADSSSISAKQGDAGLLHVSAFIDSGSVSAVQTDASKLSVSAVQQSANLLNVSAKSNDGALLRVSALQGTSSNLKAQIQGINADGTTPGNSINIGGVDTANLMRSTASTVISATPTNSSNALVVAPFQIDSGQLLVSAKAGDANQLHTSAFIDSGSVSAKQSDANNLHTSAVQADAGLQHVSSWFGVDTTGQWTVGRLSNLSSSGNVKATAGTVYGYYAYNTTTIPAYINFTNTSGAVNVGTDAVQLKIMLPPSAAANVGFPGGLKGFTNGIGAYGVSAISDGATTPVATSAVGINIFYN